MARSFFTTQNWQLQLHCLTKRVRWIYGIHGSLDKNLGEAKTRHYLANGDVIPVAMRIPANLRDSVKEVAALDSIIFSTFVRTCITNKLPKRI